MQVLPVVVMKGVLDFKTTKDFAQSLAIDDRIYLERVRQFFGHAIGNMLAAVVGALLIALVLNSAGIPEFHIIFWFSAVVFLALTVVYIERRFSQSELSIRNVKSWVAIRALLGGSVSTMYGVSPFLLLISDTSSITHEMFIFIILSAMVSVATTGYSVMPVYYIAINMVTMVPLTLYFIFQNGAVYSILTVTAIIWQLVVISKALRATRTAINAIALNERLTDEIEEHKATRKQLNHLATHDGLTGLANKRLLMDRLDIMIRESRRYKRKFALMFIDIDGFKAINDQYGHDVGDRLLQEVAGRLSKYVRETDIVARFGGDEFIVAYSELNANSIEIESIMQRILGSINESVMLGSGEVLSVSGSVGVAFYPKDGDSVVSLIQSADAAMYHVKSAGKNNFAFAVS